MGRVHGATQQMKDKIKVFSQYPDFPPQSPTT